MAGNFGVIGTKHIDFKPIIDEAYLKGLQTASGIELTELVRLTDQAMQGLNGEIDETLASLLTVTTEPETGRRRQGRKFVQKGGEYTTSRPQKITGTSYMLPFDKYEISTGFTEDGLHDISREAFEDELQAIVDAWRMLYVGEVFTALFDPNVTPIAKGSDIKSPRLAGSGSGDYAYTGTYPDGSALPGGYTHYFRVAEADILTSIKTQVARLKKQGHLPPYDLVGSSGAIDKITALTGFTWVAEAGVTVALGESVATLDPDTYLGQLPGRVRVRNPIEQLGATDHFAIYKTYGSFDPRNVLAWLYDPKWGRDAYVRARDDYPLAEAVAIQRFGIGTNDRVGATVTQIAASGSYAAPEITF